MKTEKQRLTDSIQREIKSNQELLKRLEKVPIGLISQAFPQASWWASWGDRIECSLPMSFSLVAEVKEFMAMQFPEFILDDERQHVWDAQKQAGLFLKYSTKNKYGLPETRFEFGFRSERDGSTCVLNKIGEKTVPIFEVTCKDGAEEF